MLNFAGVYKAERTQNSENRNWQEAKGSESYDSKIEQMGNSQNPFLPGAAVEENSADGDLDKVSRSET